MKIPKCPKTISGNHKFEQKIHEIGTNVVIDGVLTNQIIDPIKCKYCGLIDDRPSKVEKKKV